MSDVSIAIKKYLGVQVSDEHLNHYTLLGLREDASLDLIKQALRSTVAAWNSSDTKSDPTSAQRVAKLIKQAQADLLDPTKKKEYDEQLSYKTTSSNRSFLPSGDAFAPFDARQFLVGASTNTSIFSFGNAEKRWRELCQKIPSLAQASLALPGIENMATRSTAMAETSLESTALNLQPVSRSKSVESSAARIERLKRQRKMKQLLYVAGFVVVAFAFLGYAGFLFITNRQQLANKPEVETKEIKSAKPSEAPKPIGGGKANKPSESNTDFVLPTLSKDETSINSSVEPTEENPFGKPPVSIPMADEMKPSMPPTDAAPLPMIPTTSEPSVPAPSSDSKAKWTAAMSEAREAIRNADFATFHKKIELAQPLSIDNEMKAKQARLDQLGQLYEIFVKAIRDSKSKLRAAETLSVGKSSVSIVEIKDDELVVRIQGKNERFSWDKLPPAIASALADLSLSEVEPTDIAARAVYFSLSPTRNELYAKRVKEWFDKSVGKGSIRQDLVQALTDTYE